MTVQPLYFWLKYVGDKDFQIKNKKKNQKEKKNKSWVGISEACKRRIQPLVKSLGLQNTDETQKS